MANPIFDVKEVKAQIKRCKDEPLNCIYGPPKGSGPVAFAISKKLGAPVLTKAAKQETGGTKAIPGQAQLDGDTLTITVEELFPGMQKKLKTHFKQEKITYKVKVIDKDGNGEADDEDEEEIKVPGSPELDPEAAKVLEALKKMTPRLKLAIEAHVSKKDVLMNAANGIKTAASSGDVKSAKAGLKSLSVAIGKLSSGPAAAEVGAGGVSVMRLGKARIEWIDLRSTSISEIGRLKGLISEAYQGDPNGQAQVSSAITQLDRVFATLNENMQAQLDEVLNESDPKKRASLAATAGKTMSDFLSYVDSDPIVAAIDGNEFDPSMTVIAPLRAKLNDIGAALGA